MSIEIKSTVRKLLYTAENATDVRTALEQAVKEKVDLRYANLRSADLRYADLGYADLRSADLGSANLGSANLRYANLGSANTYQSPLWGFRCDFEAVLDAAPAEVGGLRDALLAGTVDGSTYSGRCACLVGTIAKVNGAAFDQFNLGDVLEAAGIDLRPDSSRPAEQWFLPIREGHAAVEGDLPEEMEEGVFRASVALQWIDAWTEARTRVAKVLVAA